MRHEATIAVVIPLYFKRHLLRTFGLSEATKLVLSEKSKTSVRDKYACEVSKSQAFLAKHTYNTT